MPEKNGFVQFSVGGPAIPAGRPNIYKIWHPALFFPVFLSYTAQPFIVNLNPWMGGGKMVQGSVVPRVSKNVSRTHRFGGHFLKA